MNSIVKFYKENPDELNKFLSYFFENKFNLNNVTSWEKIYANPTEIADIVAAFVDNKENYLNTNLWISLDTGVFINIKEDNYNAFIKYIFERYPY